MNTPAELQNLISEIVHDFSAAQIEWDPFPSGVSVLYVSLNGRDFELEFDPKRGTGVSENFSDTPPFIGHDKAFDSLAEAIQHFKSLLEDAVQNPRYESKEFVMHEEKLPWNKQ